MREIIYGAMFLLVILLIVRHAILNLYYTIQESNEDDF